MNTQSGELIARLITTLAGLDLLRGRMTNTRPIMLIVLNSAASGSSTYDMAVPSMQDTSPADWRSSRRLCEGRKRRPD